MATSFKVQSVDQLAKHIRMLSRITESVVFTTPALQRMRLRRVLDAEVYDCLRRGKIMLPPEEDMKTGNLVCRMECYGSSRNLAVCVALDDADPSLIVVTVLV